MVNSRISGFYKQPLSERQRRVIAELGLDPDQTSRTLNSGGLDAETADKIVENVIGTYALPLGLALNFTINGRDRLVPMVVEEPSVIAAASNAAKMLREEGGFSASQAESLMIAQIELRSVPDASRARAAIEQAEPRLLELAGRAVPGLVRRGGGPRALELRTLTDDHLVVHLLVDCCDAMGANLVNTAAEALGNEIATLAGARLGLRILSNLTDRRMITVAGRAPGAAVAPPGQDPAQVLDAIEEASIFAERDPYRAATHNKGIMNGIDSVVIATGNDYRAVEAGAHAYAAASGRYAPLATWRRAGDMLEGTLTLPLALGTVGGTLRVHPGARLALELAEVDDARDLAMLAAAAGLASNLAAIRALATEGIQRGHMSLHARSVALGVGAQPDEVDLLVQLLAESGQVTSTHATELLAKLRHSQQNPED